MKMTKKEGGDGIGYARKEAYEYEGKQYEADLQNGDVVTILDAGITESHPQYGESVKFVVKTRNGEKRTSFNQSSINVLVDAYGDDSEEWKGKTARVLIKKTMIAGERRVVAYFVTEGWYLDDFGDLVKDVAVSPRGADGSMPAAPASRTMPEYPADPYEGQVDPLA